MTVPCPRCRTGNLPSHRFCVACGQPILASGPADGRFASPDAYTPPHLAEKIRTARGTLEGERKQVTVLFADMKGSLELLADRDPEDARRMLDPVLALMGAPGRGRIARGLGAGCLGPETLAWASAGPLE
ncbi:MAG: hypothetical protein WEG40_01475 [Candidatus Rokuibacteriota bacterium]